MINKKIAVLFCAAVFAMSMFSACGGKTSDEPEMATEKEIEEAGFTDTIESDKAQVDTDAEVSGVYQAEIRIKDYGCISLELDADAAPISVKNFIKLAQEGFYDGLTFHRIIDGFMIQGGDPLGNGTGGSEETIKGEFASNGVENNISHVRGTISMARATDPDSGSSQFFIVHQDSTFLDGDYAGFGHVTEGMEVVDKICQEVVPVDDNGTVPSEEQPIIESIVILEN